MSRQNNSRVKLIIFGISGVMLLLGISDSFNASTRRGLTSVSDFKLGDFLGAGLYGAVREVAKGTDKLALKAIFIKTVHQEEYRASAQQEIDAHVRLRGKSHVVQMYDEFVGDQDTLVEFFSDLGEMPTCEGKVGESVGAHFATLELCGINLRDYLEGEDVSGEDAIDIFRDIVTGVKQMKDERLSHRDLHWANVFMINEQVLDGQKCKVGDLGKTNDMTAEEHELEALGAIEFPIPEDAQLYYHETIGYTNNKDHYRKDRKDDVISLGGILKHMLDVDTDTIMPRVPRNEMEMIGHEILKMIFSGDIKSINQLKHLVDSKTIHERHWFWTQTQIIDEPSGTFVDPDEIDE